MNTSVMALSLAILLSGIQAVWAQPVVVIESFDHNGQVTFNKVADAAQYRVEWSPTAGQSWTNFAAAAASLDAIVSPGLGVVTVSVPMLYRVVAMMTNLPPMALVSAGDFMMGHTTNVFLESDGEYDELPMHAVDVRAFYMDAYEVTEALWSAVKAYQGGNGYSYANPGIGKGTNHPVHTVSWYDAVKWCNARSERDGLTPVYYTDAGFSAVYKSGEIAPFANWAANGYRLPTEAEWEKAARGGTPDTRFPWPDYTNNIAWVKANYYAESNTYSYDLDGASGAFHPAFILDAFPYTSPVGYFAPNGYGLYDMAGNVWEWCWDWYSSTYYAEAPAADPLGPDDGEFGTRVLRGGSWADKASSARTSSRDSLDPGVAYPIIGFRCVRGL